MILIFKRTVQIAIKNLAVFVLLLVNISFKFWWYFFQMISFQHLTVCKVRQLEELCGDCLNIWGLVVFSFNFHESSRWHVLHQEHIVFCNGKSDFLFALWQLVGVDSYWAVWHLEACCAAAASCWSWGHFEVNLRRAKDTTMCTREVSAANKIEKRFHKLGLPTQPNDKVVKT